MMRVAAVGGIAAAYATARALGVVEGEEAWAGAPALGSGSGKGAKVVILGAGVAGLSAAYELGRAGYACTVLEARDRVGGRNWSIRKGTVLEMTDGSRQVCGFDDGYYFNAGPARIPSHHTATLGYCREFGVQMETLVNYSGSALIQSDRLNGAKPIKMRQAVHDSRGHFAELLAKSVKGGGLDKILSKDDTGKLLAAAAQWGALVPPGSGPFDPDAIEIASSAKRTVGSVYAGTTSAGYTTPPGAGDQVGVAAPPLPAETVLDPFVLGMSNFHEVIDMQATMQQPVGGMDKIPMAMKSKLAPGVLHQGCEVRKIARKTLASGKTGVEITYFDKTTRQTKTVVADYCICTVPLKVLSTIPSDFSPDRKAAINKAVYENAMKIAFQAPRFWEREDQIYGGLSLTDRDTFITWYPSSGFHTPEGVLVAGYTFGDQATRFGALPFADRVAYAKGTIDRLHPGRGRLLKAPIAIEWGKVPYNLGIACPLDEEDPAAYKLLGEADGPFYFAGEHLSHVGAWQQGAIVSAHRAATMLDARHRQGAAVSATRSQ
jgi:monoamine oxidase